MIALLYTIVAILAIYLIVKSTKKHKNFPPGPPKLPLVGSLPYLGIGEARGSPLHIQVNNSKKYGKIWGAYMGSEPIVYINDYALAKEAMGMEELTGRPNNIPVSFVRPGFGHPNLEGGAPGIGTAQGQYWREQRRFTLRHLRDRGLGKNSMEESLMEEVEKLSDYFRSKKGEPVDLTLGFNISIINALWMILMGEKLPLNDPKVGEVFDKLNTMISASSMFSPLVLMLPKREMMMWPGIKHLLKIPVMEKAFQGMFGLITKNVTDHKARLRVKGADEEDSDFLDTFLKKQESEKTSNPAQYDKSFANYSLLNTFTDLFIAGSETTSSSLVWTMLYLVHHPDIQAKVHEELDRVVGASRPVSLDDSNKLPYVNAVLQESFRMTGLAYCAVPHKALEDVNIQGFFIPKNTTVITCVYEIMKNPERYEEPETFRPERFIDASGNFIKDDNVIPFGIGKRYCLGQSLAEKEFFLFFARLLQNFSIKNYPGKPLPGYGLKDSYPEGPVRAPPADLRVLIEERQ